MVCVAAIQQAQSWNGSLDDNPLTLELLPSESARAKEEYYKRIESRLAGYEDRLNKLRSEARGGPAKVAALENEVAAVRELLARLRSQRDPQWEEVRSELDRRLDALDRSIDFARSRPKEQA